MTQRRLALGVGLLGALALLLSAAPGAPRVPALVFVSRNALGGPAAGQVPGLGPGGRLASAGGALMRRDRDGRVRPLLAKGALYDASDPSVSWDGRRIAFAGLAAPESAWRIYVVNADGRALHAITRADTTRAARVDDFDPCWMPDGRIVFASTRYPQVAADGGPASNLFIVRADGAGLERLTSDRHGAEEPAIDPASGRIVYARWWTSRWLPSERDPSGITLDRSRAVPEDTVNLWHAISVLSDAQGARLAGGDPRGRASVTAYQPGMLADGSLYGVVAERTSLTPNPGRLGVRVFPKGFAAPRALAGLYAGDSTSVASACAPVALPEGGYVVSLDARGDGDYDLVRVTNDGRIAPIVTRPGTLELDAAPLEARRTPPVAVAPRDEPPPERPATHAADVGPDVPSFRFDCLNVFDSGAIDTAFPDAPPMQRGVRIRFYAALARPAAAGGDTAILLAEHPVRPNGSVHVDAMPADVPMFEQLVDANGHVLRSPMGPTHVPGFNFAPAGSGTKCVGCHAGHSALTVPASAGQAEWINASPSAEVAASSAAADGPARAAVNRRSREPGWVARSAVGENLQLRWRWPIEVASVVLYACPRDPAAGTDLQVLESELVLSLGGEVVERKVIREAWSASGTRVACDGRRVDAIEIRPIAVRGRVLHRDAVAIAEVETIARLSAN